MSESREKTCGNCRHWRNAICHLNYEDIYNLNLLSGGVFPATHEGDWCLSWRSRLTTEQTITNLRARLAAAEEHEEQTHTALREVLGNEDCWENLLRDMASRLAAAEGEIAGEREENTLLRNQYAIANLAIGMGEESRQLCAARLEAAERERDGIREQTWRRMAPRCEFHQYRDITTWFPHYDRHQCAHAQTLMPCAYADCPLLRGGEGEE